MSAETETVDPDPTPPADRPLGRNYWRLFTAASISNLGDGIDGAALPLLAAALTRDPVLFAGVAVVNRLPWLLFTLPAGAIADRYDRKWIMTSTNVVRFALFGVLGAAVLGDWATIWLLYLVTFLTGVAEVLFDTSWQPILPAVVEHPDQLEKANGRLFGVQTVMDQFIGPPVGGFLFAVGAAVPILLDAGTFLVAAGLIAGMTGSYVARGRPPVAAMATDPEADPGADPGADTVAEPLPAPARTRLRDDIAEGVRWLRGHRLLRTLALLLGAMNGLMMLSGAIFALYALEVLGVGEIGFGLLMTAMAAGAAVGSLAAGPLVERVGRGPALWTTLLASVVLPVTQGLTSDPWVFAALSAVFGFVAVVWNVITVSLRQTIIPDHLLGRVNSVYRWIAWGSMPIGAFLGGLIADAFGLRAPFFVAGAVMALALVPASRIVTTRAIEDARAAATS